MNIGKTILELRRKKNVTQEELAAELGVTAAAVSKWENGYTLPDILMLCALSDYFEVTVDELLGRNRERKHAVIAAETLELGRKIEALAKQHGILINGIYQDYPDARAAAEADSTIRYLIAGYYDGAIVDDCSIRKLISIHNTDDQILEGFQQVFKAFAD